MRKEHAKELVKVNYEADLVKKTKVPDDRVTEEDIFRESVQGLGIMSEDEDYQTEEENADDQEEKPIKQPIRAEDRKDKKDRRKEKRQLLQTIRYNEIIFQIFFFIFEKRFTQLKCKWLKL